MHNDKTLAVIGCGAIADQYYLPAIAAHQNLRKAVMLVDPSLERRQQAIQKFGFPTANHAGAVEELPDSIVFAVNATPSHLHVETTLTLLARQIGVLVEKPLAENATDAQMLVDSCPAGCVLSSNYFRRLTPSYRAVADLIRSGRIGDVTYVSWSEGHKFDWPTQSGFYFRRPWGAGRPRGALLDIGVHILDAICWWLNDVPVPVRVEVDGYGGPEAYVRAALTTANASIEVDISFHAKLANRFLVEGTRGALRGYTSDYSQFELRDGEGSWQRVTAKGAARWTSICGTIVQNCIDAITEHKPLLINARDVIPGLSVIDSMYASAIEIRPACYQEWVRCGDQSF